MMFRGRLISPKMLQPLASAGGLSSIRERHSGRNQELSMSMNHEFAPGRSMRARPVLIALSSVLIALPGGGQVSRAEPTRPLGDVEQYTFANPQTPLGEIQENCKLNGEQTAKVGEIQSAAKKTVGEYAAARAEELQAAREAMTAATNKGDFVAAATLTQKVRDLEKPMTDAREKARFDILAVLTRDQVQAWRKGCVIKSIRFTYGTITFTPEQLTQIGAMYDDCAGQANATFEEINAQLSRKVLGILSAKQKQTMGLK
jgi:hypothetical protein